MKKLLQWLFQPVGLRGYERQNDGTWHVTPESRTNLIKAFYSLTGLVLFYQWSQIKQAQLDEEYDSFIEDLTQARDDLNKGLPNLLREHQQERTHEG